jgi:hypothetical protein
MATSTKKSAGLYQSYSDYDRVDTNSYNALTNRGKSADYGFDVGHNGEYMPRDLLQPDHHAQAGTYEPKDRSLNPKVVPMPSPQDRMRDDLYLDMVSKKKPRPY